jgi:translation elongation factor aEF-2
MADEELEAIKGVIENAEQIRNIAIAAHIDHGKCVAPDQRVSIADGSQVEAEEVFERYRTEGEPVEQEEGELRVSLPENTLQVTSFNRSSGTTETKEVTDMWRMEKDEDLVEVCLENGREVTVTPEHEFTVLSQNGTFDMVEAHDLEPDQVVVASRQLEATNESSTEARILEEISDNERFYARLGEMFADELRTEIKSEGMEDLYDSIQPVLELESFKNCVWRGEYRVQTLVQVAKRLEMGLDDIYSEIESLNVRGTESKGEHSSLEMSPADDTESLFYIAGMFFGDGDTEGNITNGNRHIQQTVVEKSAALGLEPHVREFDDRTTRIELGGKTLNTFLREFFGYPESAKSGSISVPQTVFEASRTEVSAFIRGYMDADGTVEEARSAVSVGSKSTQMLDDLQLLLQRFDIASKLNRRNGTLYVSGELSVDRFREEIGFEHPEKSEKLLGLSNRAESSKLDAVPIDGKVLQEARSTSSASQTDLVPSYSSYENNHVGLSKRSLSRIIEGLEQHGANKYRLNKLQRLAVADTVFSRVESKHTISAPEHVYDFTVEDHHNFVCEGVVVENTTLTDNLLARAGMISDKLAGDQRFMDFDDQEAERGITIYSANISMVHEFDDDDYLINLIDTPGHVDFGGDVTRAMRAVDGVLVLVDAVDGVMPQTETVMKQALQEGVRPILFINKVDRLIEEMQLTPEEMQERFQKIIREVNTALRKYADEETADAWEMGVQDGTVAFGSALKNWAISFPYMQETGIDFGKMIDRCQDGDHDGLSEDAPIEEVVLDMVVKHLDDPQTSADYRVPKVWPGDPDNEAGESMAEQDADGPLIGVVTNVEDDEHAGTIATARLFSGTIEEGDELYGIGSQKTERAQQVGIYSGPRKLMTDSVPAGNIVAITGPDFSTGETFIKEGGTEIQPFEQIEHVFEPVVTKSIEPKRTSDLPKLIESLRKRSKEDNTIEVDIDEETGETLVSGLGELHIEAKVERHLEEQGIDIDVSEPIVVFREGIEEESAVESGKSPNRHNELEISVEPLADETRRFFKEDYEELESQADDQTEVRDAMVDAGLTQDEADSVVTVHEENVFINASRGIKNLREIQEYLVDAFQEFTDEGPLASEPVIGLKVKLHDASLHEDAIHRGPAQMIPATKDAMSNGFLTSKPRVIEPKQILRIDTPSDTMGDAMTEVNNRRGDIVDMEEEGDSAVIRSKLPVEELFGFEAALKSATNGKGFYNLMDLVFEPLPMNLQEEKIMEIRERKGMKQEMPRPGE